MQPNELVEIKNDIAVYGEAVATLIMSDGSETDCTIFEVSEFYGSETLFGRAAAGSVFRATPDEVDRVIF